MNKPVNAGEVRITLAGEDRVLRSSLRAARIVSTGQDGFVGALQRLSRFDLDAFVSIIAAGLGREPKDVEEAVFETGLPDLVEPTSKYVGYLMRGGREATAPGEAEAPKGKL